MNWKTYKSCNQGGATTGCGRPLADRSKASDDVERQEGGFEHTQHQIFMPPHDTDRCDSHEMLSRTWL